MKLISLMAQRFIRLLVVFTVAGLGCVVTGRGEEADTDRITVPELEALRLQHRAPIDKVATERMERLEKLQGEYLKLLEDLRRSQTAQGDLDAVLITKAEQERATQWSVLTDAQRKAMPASVGAIAPKI